ncbi:MAG TPA: arylamine N-acetyltransferase [Allosphingosinicella sp.]|nr:arylamine N-acetyltransferase [Allosphingosinicella sp.]
MDLSAYLERIGHAGPVAPTYDSLAAIMRAHVAAIPFENLDVQLGRPIAGDLPAIFAKLVGRRRGGWCYEQNGLLGWALETIGFEVVRVAGGVMRVVSGDNVLGNHLALVVLLDRPWLVDAGFGGSLAEPIALAPAAHRHAPYELSLARIEDDYWRYEEWIRGRPFSFDFRFAPADPALLARQQARLQTDPDSPFVLNLVAQRRSGDSHASLRGRVLSLSRGESYEDFLIEDAETLVDTLRTRFALDVPEIAALWPRICDRHEALFG